MEQNIIRKKSIINRILKTLEAFFDAPDVHHIFSFVFFWILCVVEL